MKKFNWLIGTMFLTMLIGLLSACATPESDSLIEPEITADVTETAYGDYTVTTKAVKGNINDAEITYTWYENDVKLNETGMALVIDTSDKADGTYTYKVNVKATYFNREIYNKTFEVKTITVDKNPTVSASLNGYTVVINNASGKDIDVTYAWYENDVLVGNDATLNTFSSNDGSYEYKVVVTASYRGTVVYTDTLNAESRTVDNLPTVSASLSDYTVNVTVIPASKETDTVITYTWYKNGIKTSDTGATADTTVVNGVDTYKCVVTATYKGKTADVENNTLETSKDNWVVYYKTTATFLMTYYKSKDCSSCKIVDSTNYVVILSDEDYTTLSSEYTYVDTVEVYSYDGENFYTEKDTSSTLVYPVTTE